MELPIITLVTNMRLQCLFNGISAAFIDKVLILKPNSNMVDKDSNKWLVGFQFPSNPDISRRELNKVDDDVKGRKAYAGVYVRYIFAQSSFRGIIVESARGMKKRAKGAC